MSIYNWQHKMTYVLKYWYYVNEHLRSDSILDHISKIKFFLMEITSTIKKLNRQDQTESRRTLNLVIIWQDM